MKIKYNRLISPLSMVKIIFALSLTLFFETASSQEVNSQPDTTRKSIDPVSAEKAKAVALKYIQQIAKGENVDSLLNLSSVPFSWDRKEIISERAVLRQKYMDMISDKGKGRTFIIDTVFIRATRKEILDNIIPLDVYSVVVKIKLVKETGERVHGVLLGVQMNDNPKIVGFSD